MSSPWRPAQRAEKMPGAPPSTSTDRPESSAIAIRPVARATARALSREFSAKAHTGLRNIGCVHAGCIHDLGVNVQAVRCGPRRISRSSLSLPLLWLARTIFASAMVSPLQQVHTVRGGAPCGLVVLQGLALNLGQLCGALQGQVEQAVELFAVEGRALGGCPEPQRTCRYR